MPAISNASFQFLQKLKNNNNRPWFEKNRSRYEESRLEFITFVSKVVDGIKKIETLPEKEPSKYVYRIYRDIRFSKDKTPYKIFFSCLIQRGPEERVCPYYIQVQPGKTMVGGGVWDPSPDILRNIRQEIDYNGVGLKKIIQSHTFRSNFEEIKGDKLSRPPKGYEINHPELEFLKMKQFFIRKEFEDKIVLSDDFIPEILKAYKAAIPFFKFFDQAMGE